MAAVPDRMQRLGLPPELLATHHIRFLPEADRSVISSISYGVLFVMAFWSGPARKAFVELKRVLAATDPDGHLELVVVDTDGCADLYEVPGFAGKLHGAGETAWVRNGKILFTSGLRFRPECFEPNTRGLLKA